MNRAETLQSEVSSRAQRVTAERVSTCFHSMAPEGVEPSRPFEPRILNPNTGTKDEPDQPNLAEVAHSDTSGFTPVARVSRAETLQSEPPANGRASAMPEYAVWLQMRQRCTNPKHHKYPRYGARGIQVCPQWQANFANFIADMGRRPSPQHSLDRIDNDGNYEPGNCRWATATEQAVNRSTSFGNRGLTATFELTCEVCGSTAVRNRKYVATTKTCSRKCAAAKAGRASGASRRKTVAA